MGGIFKSSLSSGKNRTEERGGAWVTGCLLRAALSAGSKQGWAELYREHFTLLFPVLLFCLRLMLLGMGNGDGEWGMGNEGLGWGMGNGEWGMRDWDGKWGMRDWDGEWGMGDWLYE
ncbi:hypothetical protein BDZ91DRAFT_758376 [Kalaharituber pfeilii]|nr:hypothetical protein BDZ91DRAFT_758376 [Kalaharituber pfeilii]